MKIEYDHEKRLDALERRGLDMAEAALVFDGPHVTVEDTRHDYGERRFVTSGLLRGRLVFVAWTQRGSSVRVISMRKANDREIARSRI